MNSALTQVEGALTSFQTVLVLPCLTTGWGWQDLSPSPGGEGVKTRVLWPESPCSSSQTSSLLPCPKGLFPTSY